MNLRSMFKKNLQIINIILFSLKRFINYQIISKIIITIVLFPLIKKILFSLANSAGFSSLSNGEIVHFILSLNGFLGVSLALICALFVVLIELGGLIVLSHQTYVKDRESSFFQILRFLISRMGKLLSIGSIIILISFLIFAPYLNDGFGVEFANLNIPGFIKDFILHNTFLHALLNIFTFLGAITAFFCIFSFHIVLLENISAYKAIVKSWKLVYKNFTYIFKELLIQFILNLFLVIFSISLYIALGLGIYHMCSNDFKFIAAIILIALFVFFFFIAYLILLPMHIMQINILYYHLINDIPKINIKTKSTSFIRRTLSSLLVCLVLFSIIVSYVIIGLEDNPYYNTSQIKVTAHRGSSTLAPENTLAALNTAISHGADYAELDTTVAKDGTIVVSHDYNFKRVAGVNKNVWDMNIDEIKKLDVGSPFSPKFKGERIPTLKEYIQSAKGKINLNIEIKRDGHDKDLVKSVVKIIEDNKFVDSCVVTSLDYNSLMEVRKLNPKIKIGYIMFVALGNLKNLDVDFYSVEETNVTDNFVNNAHKLGRQVHVWTINEQKDIDKMIDLNVDNIITDNDSLVISSIKESKEWNKLEDKFANDLFLFIKNLAK